MRQRVYDLVEAQIWSGDLHVLPHGSMSGHTKHKARKGMANKL